MTKSLALVFVLTAVASAQSFEVASIRRNNSGATRSSSTADFGRLTMRNVTVQRCVMKAYGVREDQIVGSPSMPATSLNTFIGGPGRMNAKGVSMPNLAARLTDLLGVPVVDETELHGYFDFELRWDANETQPNPLPPDPSSAVRPAPAETDGRSLLMELQDRLGLKVQSRKIPTDTVVIDHVAFPTEN